MKITQDSDRSQGRQQGDENRHAQQEQNRDSQRQQHQGGDSGGGDADQVGKLLETDGEIIVAGRKRAGGVARAQRGEGDEGETEPPEAGRSQADAGDQGFGQANAAGEEEHNQVEDQQQPAAQVAHRPAVGGNPVALVFAGDVGQVGVVKDHAGAEGQVGDDEEDAPQPVQAGGDEEEQDGRHGAQRAEDLHQALAQVRIICQGAQDGQEGDLEQHGGGDEVGEVRIEADGDAQQIDHAAGIGGSFGDGGEVGTQKDGDDGGAEGADGPVEHAPAEDLALVVDHGDCGGCHGRSPEAELVSIRIWMELSFRPAKRGRNTLGLSIE